MTLFSEQVPEQGRARLGGKTLDTDSFQARGDLVVHTNGLGQAGEVTLNISQKYRHAHSREVLGQNLQSNCLAGTGGSGNHSMPVGGLCQ